MLTKADSIMTYRLCPSKGEHGSVTTRILAYFMQRKDLEYETKATNQKKILCRNENLI